MRKEDYDAIAKIMQKGMNMSNAVFTPYGIMKQVVKDLADYFEKEETEQLKGEGYNTRERIAYRTFNRQDFLKKCGV